MASLAEMRARIKAQENKTSNNSTGSSDNAVYPHWNMPEGQVASLRFLPDGNTKNEFFWVERQVIKLPFDGIKGDPSSKQVTIQVPCVEMYGDNCPILAEVRTWFKDPALEEMGKKYWKKRSYLFQGFVRQNPMSDDVTPANPIRRFIISPQLIPLIKAGIVDPEVEELPTHYGRGLDFFIKKTSKGGYADYSTSNWSRKESALTEAEQAAIETHGLFDLSTFLPKRPTEVELKIMKEMFEASVDGQPYDLEKWGEYFRPYGVDAPAGSTSKTSTSDSTSAPSTGSRNVSQDDDLPFEPDAPVVVPSTSASMSSDKAQDILAKIRARQGNQV